jgi:penicillin amidase
MPARRLLKLVISVLALVVVVALAGAMWARSELRASLPRLDGRLELKGLSAPVEISRDRLGVPTIRGGNREDVARATGFVHAQDRFFQMDLARRRAAGELAALVGPRALEADRDIRIHRFRIEAQQALAQLGPRDRAIVDAYTEGVNAGLRALDTPPFEYAVLRQEPESWRAEDSLLVVLSMFIILQDSDGSYESTLGTMHDVLPREMFDFLAPRGTEWDAPIVGEAFATPVVPGPDVYDLRALRASKPTVPRPTRPEVVRNWNRGSGIGDPGPESALAVWTVGDDERDAAAIGSNSWVVAGGLTSNGGALVANDMHLTVRVPNTWYRAALEWPEPSNPSGRQLIGVMLPGVPTVVAGSNTHVAWGFTNTYADWSDIVLLEIDPQSPDRYRTPEGWRNFERYDEVIRVAGEPDQHQTARWTIWGPVIEPDYLGRPRAFKWVAHSVERLAMSVTPLESATTVEEAFDAVNGLGTPGQNFVVADSNGQIGWSVFGSLPRRAGLDGQLPTSWADGTRGWNGWLSDLEYPRILNPPSGRIWTANNRVVDGEMLAKLGDGSYEIGSRAHRIRERLIAQERFTPKDLLAIQLDAGAQFLSRWRDLLLRTLTSTTTMARADRTRLRDVVDGDWDGTAAPGSAAYRLTRAFRDAVFQRVIAFVLSECYEADSAFDYTMVRRREGPIWKLVTEQPLHLLDPRYPTWEQLLLESIDAVIEETGREQSVDLGLRVWGEYNVTAYRHPLSAGIPVVGRWLDMPAHALPGDLYTPRVHWGAVAASQRMVVSPGREAEGIMQMPTGQSGHPLSPFYANSHDAWVRGDPAPFLPGPAEHTLTLYP